MSDLVSKIKSKALSQNGWVRLPLLLFFFYIFYRQITDITYEGILSPLNLGVHEVGHLLFRLLGEFMGIVGGTIFQLLVPVYGMYNFYRQEDYFSITLCFGWYATNCFNVATYMADARAMELPLVSPFGGDVYHDWNYLLAKMGLLKWDHFFAFLYRVEGFCAYAFCLVLGSWMLWLMITGKSDDV